MDIILLILLVIFCVLAYFLLVKQLSNKRKSYTIYILLGVINILLLIFYYYSSNIERMTQKGGNNRETEKRKKLLEKCGLPDNYSTSHCFNDMTHHTCCKLGPKAREYADSTNNPIGKASVRAFKEKFGRAPKKGELTGWCTCFGSKVCSNYSEKFPGDTKIKFINNPQSKKEIRSAVPNKCEEYFREKYSVQEHETPGVYNKNKKINRTECENEGKLEIV